MGPMPSSHLRSLRIVLALNALALTILAAAITAGRGDAAAPLGVLASTASASPREADFIPKSTVAAVAHRVSPAVVTIGAVRESYRPADDFFRAFVIRQDQYQPYLGSGVLISEDGHIITNVHVIEGAKQVVVTFSDGREFPAAIAAVDKLQDIALLKIEGRDLPDPLPLGDSDALQIGEDVIALGNPFGPMMQDPRPTVTRGVVSAVHRNFRPDASAERVYTGMIQTDAAINPGNSGGPLVDMEGNVVGVNTFIFSRSGGSHGIGFAIPVNRVKSMLDEIRQYGRLRNVAVDFDAVRVQTQRLAGVMLRAIARKGPAEKAGLAPGDVILAVDGRNVSTPDDLYLTIGARQVGERLTMQVWREGKTFDATYEVAEATSRRR